MADMDKRVATLEKRFVGIEQKHQQVVALAEKLCEQRDGYRETLQKALAALKRWDGANERDSYADQFVWQAHDLIKKALGE